jgi:phthiocerol/phenolphthiocerol synthesis type-I polyketide synthase E
MSNAAALSQTNGLEIAVIGMSGSFPGSRTVEQFWRNVRDGVESITFFSDRELEASGHDAAQLRDPSYVKARGALEDIEMFDASFFGFSPREAEITDPQQRLMLECAWEALESGGYDPATYKGRIGVYAGVSISTYLLVELLSNSELLKSTTALQLLLGNDKDHVSTRISYKLNLKGPSVTIQTSCSTSLVAVHLACQSLLSGECDIALAGGASIGVPHRVGYYYQEGGILSPDGHCRAFDARGQGTVSGSGAAIVALKRLADALSDGDCIRAVIKGSAINNDGSLKVGYTAPSETGQAEAIRAAQFMAEVEPETITYIEAHGTATALGDPIEIKALTQAFRAGTDKKNFCAIGSVKTNIGHLDAGAGVAGLIKTTLALEHREIPPSLHFEKPNPKIDFADSPFFVNAKLTPWETNGLPRRAGVSSFGIGGTNAHVIVEEAPAFGPTGKGRDWQLLVLSAKTETALETLTLQLVEHLKQHPQLNFHDVAHTLQVGRGSFKHRRMLACRDAEDAISALGQTDARRSVDAFREIQRRPVVFMFPGQGTQYVNMAAELYSSEAVFRKHIDACCELLEPLLKLDLRQLLFPRAERAADAARELEQTCFTQPALFVVEYALAQMWMAWGVRPQAFIGHSIGEYVAACLSRVFTLEDALRLVAARGRMIQSLAGGAMLAVPLGEREVLPLLGDQLSLAAVNGASSCVVSGSVEAIEELQERLNESGQSSRRLHTSHAFHSSLMNPIIESFTAQVRAVKLNPPHIPYLSNVTGDWITAHEATAPGYWAKHLRQTVRFADGLGKLLKDPDNVLLETGPGTTLTTLARRHPERTEALVAIATLPHPRGGETDVEFVTKSLGQLWLAGVEIDWTAYHAAEQRRRVPLPTYPFERQRYWISGRKQAQKTNTAQASPVNISSNLSPQVVVSKSDLAATTARIEVQAPFREETRAHAVEPFKFQTEHRRPALSNNYVAARIPNERIVAEMWQDVLGVKQVGAHDNFFQLGGDSLLALQLVSQLRQSFNVELSHHAFLEAPTVAEVAALIGTNSTEEAGAGSARAHSSALVEIQRGESQRPLILIPPSGGNLYFYQDLVRRLGPQQAVLGLQPKGLDDDEEPFTNLEELASYYLEALREAQPTGPYLFGGASFGGAVAFEMSRQLEAQNQKVALLVLFDTPAPHQVRADIGDENAFLDSLISDLVPGALVKFRQLAPADRLSFVVEQLKQAQKLPAHVDLQLATRILRVWRSDLEALSRYAPETYRGRAIFFRARERDRGMPQYPEQPWIEMAGGGLEVHVAPGGHFTMFMPPHVESLAARFQAHLAEAIRSI